MVGTWCHLPLVLTRGDWEYDAVGGNGDWQVRLQREQQISLQTNLMDFPQSAVWEWLHQTRALVEQSSGSK